jgi:hypothetical protein
VTDACRTSVSEIAPLEQEGVVAAPGERVGKAIAEVEVRRMAFFAISFVGICGDVRDPW